MADFSIQAQAYDKDFINLAVQDLEQELQEEKSLETITDWLLNQVSPTFAAVIECTGGQIISDMMDEGGKRMHKNHGNLLSQYGK